MTAKMYLFAVLVMLSSLITASTPTAGLFNITSFYNSGSPHSTYATVSFILSTTSPSPLTSVSCTYTQSTLPTIATTTTSIPCNDRSVLFSFECNSAGNGYYISLMHVSNGNTTVDAGLVYMGSNVTTVVDDANPNGNYQMLVHDSDFGVWFNRMESSP